MTKLYNLARMTTSTSGTGNITLGSAVSGFLSFAGAGVSDGETVSYAIKDGANSEIGTGVYTSSGTTLSRSVTKSTNSDSAISLSGSAEVFITARAEDLGIGQHTIWVPAAAMEPAVTTAPASSNAIEIGTSLFAARTMDFATDADDFAYFSIQMPKSWDNGTLVAQFVWTRVGGTNNGVSWGIAATALADADLLSTAFSAPVVVDDAHTGSSNQLAISPESSALTVAGSPADEEFVMFEISRDVSDANDTMTVDALLLGVKIHYAINAGNDS